MTPASWCGFSTFPTAGPILHVRLPKRRQSFVRASNRDALTTRLTAAAARTGTAGSRVPSLSEIIFPSFLRGHAYLSNKREEEADRTGERQGTRILDGERGKVAETLHHGELKMMIGGKRAGSVDGRAGERISTEKKKEKEREGERGGGRKRRRERERERSSARKGVLNKKATRKGAGARGRGPRATLKRDVASGREGRRWGHDDSAGRKKSRAARELSRSRCVEPHPSRPLPSPSRISSLSFSALCLDPFPAEGYPAGCSLAPTGTHRRAYLFFIIGIDRRLLFYNNRGSAVATLSFCNARGTNHASEEEEEGARKKPDRRGSDRGGGISR